MKIEKNLIESIACGKSSNEEVVEIAKAILEKGLYDKFEEYASQVDGDGNSQEDIDDCILEFSWNGAKITADVSESDYPGGKMEFYGMTPDISFKNMMEAIDKQPDYMKILSGRVFTVWGEDQKYKLVEEDGERYLTLAD